jgi:carbon monoxide dehydrogenase subunit G
MELTNEFTVAAPVDEAWPLLTDIERIAPCVPGFKLTGSKDGEYTGTMKVKVGAVTTAYDCVIRFVEVDDAQHRAVIAARGKETKGQGGVTANITSTLVGEGDTTRASVVTNLDVTGKVAQFGRGILADVSDRMVKQFVKQLEKKLSEGDEPAADAAAAGAPSGAAPANGVVNDPSSSSNSGSTSAAAEESEPLDLLSVAGGPVIKRVAPVAAVLLLVLLVLTRVRGRGGR